MIHNIALTLFSCFMNTDIFFLHILWKLWNSNKCKHKTGGTCGLLHSTMPNKKCPHWAQSVRKYSQSLNQKAQVWFWTFYTFEKISKTTFDVLFKDTVTYFQINFLSLFRRFCLSFLMFSRWHLFHPKMVTWWLLSPLLILSISSSSVMSVMRQESQSARTVSMG